MKRVLATLFIALVLTPHAVASVPAFDERVTGHLIDYGIVRMTNQQQRYGVPGQPGRYAINSKVQFTETTDRIPLEKGIAFGIVWAISGLKEKRSIEVLYSVKHPEITLENGKKSTRSSQKMKHPVIDGVAGSADGYVLNQDYELVPGDWTVSITYQDIEISKTFKVQ
jgi:hypothetical protein